MRPNLNREKLSVVAYAFHPSYCRKCKVGGWLSRLARAKAKTVSPK
jgi:hypothetical protein